MEFLRRNRGKAKSAVTAGVAVQSQTEAQPSQTMAGYGKFKIMKVKRERIVFS